MFERPENIYSSTDAESQEMFVTPPPGIFNKNDRPDEAWVKEQEVLLNQKYPGRNLLLNYHSWDNKMHVVENASDTSPGYPTRPLDEWLEKQK